MLIERRDVRVLSDGWYVFKVDSLTEVADGYGLGVRVAVSVVGGSCAGSRVFVQTDRVATRSNKLGRLLAACGFVGGEGGAFDLDCIVGRRFTGKVVRYNRNGRVKCKVVEFLPFDGKEARFGG